MRMCSLDEYQKARRFQDSEWTNDRAGFRPLLHAVPRKPCLVSTANFIAGWCTAESKLRLRGKMPAKDGYI